MTSLGSHSVPQFKFLALINSFIYNFETLIFLNNHCAIVNMPVYIYLGKPQ